LFSRLTKIAPEYNGLVEVLALWKIRNLDGRLDGVSFGGDGA
jgi:hypothetical protein